MRFILANDPAAHFRFATLQSDAGRAALAAAGKDPAAAVANIVVLDDDGVHERSDAALCIVRGLRAPWPTLGVLRVIPLRLRDRAYDWIARHRYRWFGKRDTCVLPTPEQRARFL